jgi:hypothetical protein
MLDVEIPVGVECVSISHRTPPTSRDAAGPTSDEELDRRRP